jgi:hypothetical protein
MPRHVVVDGSNLATEGRSKPSLQQLNEAVTAFIAEHPTDLVTVVVDATFGHRIDPKEVAEFDEAVANNELVAPPAGAVGRGDAFVLAIADKVGATVLSNDSFQEFHGEYEWLFHEGRLIGGKPVPHIGWVFVERTPVRGERSRRATRESKRKAAPAATRKPSPAASQPMPVPTKPPPAPAKPPTGSRVKAVVAPEPPKRERPAAGAPVNELLPYLTFVEHHPVGSSVNAVVESYSSHGCYVSIGDIRGYVPLRLMADPPPRSAREVMKIGDAVTLVVESYAPARRSIDLAVPHVATGLHLEATATPAPGEVLEVAVEQQATSPAKKPAAKKAPATKVPATKTPAKQPAAATAPKKAAPKKPASKKATAGQAATSAPDANATTEKAVPTAKATAKKAAPTAKATATKAAPAAKATATKAAPKKAAPTAKAVAKKAAPAAKVAATKAAPAAKKAAPTVAAKAPSKKAPAKASAQQAAAEQVSKASPKAAGPATPSPARKRRGASAPS